LIKEADEEGFYENFGREQQRGLEKIMDRVLRDDAPYEVGRKAQEILDDFDEWRSNFDLTALRELKEKENDLNIESDKTIKNGKIKMD